MFRGLSNMPRRHRNILAAALVLSYLAQPCRATEIVVAVAKNGIVVASDSKQLGAPDVADKVMVFNSKVAVAVTGTEKIRLRTLTGAVVFYLEATSLLNDTRSSLPSNSSMSLIESTVTDRLRDAMKGLSPYVANGSFRKEDASGGDLIDIIFAGYKMGIPTVDVIGVICDWDARQLSDPKLVVFNPSQSRPDNTNILLLGRSDAIQRAADPISREAKAVANSYPGVLVGFNIMRHNGSLVRSATGVTIACDMIRLHGEFDPEDVGPPINIVVLSLSHKPDVRKIPR
jgi:hypothetical protein